MYNTGIANEAQIYDNLNQLRDTINRFVQDRTKINIDQAEFDLHYL